MKAGLGNHMTHLILALWASIYLTTASAATSPTATPITFQPGQLTNPVTCKADPTQSYAVYIPVKGNSQPLPIIYFFDPHADGALPLNKYKALADAYGFILVGSNNSKNGNDWATTENIWRRLADDTKSRLKIDPRRVYTCGFSGGAKVASYIALQHPGITGVIAGGAGLPDGTPAGDFPFSFTAIAGEGDMNLTELEALNGELDKTRTRHRFIHFDGRHEWAPENVMHLAFAGLQFDAMRAALIPKSDINSYITKSKERLAADYKAGQLIKAGQECQLSIDLLDGLTAEVGWFKKEAASLAGDAKYQQQRQQQQYLLVREQNTKEEYMQHFRQGDIPYWTATIADLQAKAGARTAETGMYQRLLAYLSLAFYSFSNRLIGAGQNDEARYFVELYKKADPTNSEAWYFSAILHARAGEIHAAKDDLGTATKKGFRDKDRLQRQPEFQNLSPLFQN